jgi:hypothetical protein
MFVLKMRGALMQFHCRTCRCLWLRIQDGASYQWKESSAELDALTVPGGNGRSPRAI